MKKSSNFEMIKLGLILVIYAVASCTILAIVNNITSPKIKQNQINKANNAMKVVFENANSFENALDYSSLVVNSITISDLYLAKQDDKIVGGVVQVAGPTYDKAKIMLGVNLDGTISGVQFLENTDSPGFGLKASDSTYKLANGKTFYGQFVGKDSSKGFTVNENFDGISGATITSVGVGNLITQGSYVILNYFKEHNIE